MSVVRVVKTRGYTVMSNFHLRDGRLSLKAKGLLSVMLSLPDEWDYTVRGLASIGLDGIDAVRTGIAELERAGYVTRERSRDELGRLAGCDYTVYERPMDAGETPDVEEPALENPTQASPAQGKPTQLNKEGRSKEGSITERPITEGEAIAAQAPGKPLREPRRRCGLYGNVLLSESEAAKLKELFPADWEERVERLDEYIETSGKRYKNHLLVIRRWARKDEARAAGAAGQGYSYEYDEGDVL